MRERMREQPPGVALALGESQVHMCVEKDSYTETRDSGMGNGI